MITTITNDLLDALSARAAGSLRKRANHNIHAGLDEPVHRLFNAIEPGTYVRPQRHADPATFETVLLVRGAAVLLLFDDHGTVRERIECSSRGPLIGFDIPAGAWHAMAALSPGTVFFEVKQGPYRPSPPGHMADWAPAEGDPDANAFEAWYRSARPGAVPPPRLPRSVQKR